MRDLSDIEALFSAQMPDIQSAGYQSFDPIWAEKEHCTRGTELLHVVSGAVDEHMCGRRFEARPGDTLMIPSEVQHRDAFDPAVGVEVVLCVIDWAREREYFELVDNDALLALPPQCKAELASHFDSLRGDLSGAGLADKLVARCRLLTILLLALRETLRMRRPKVEGQAPTGKQRRQDLMEEAKAYLRRRYTDCVSLDEVASALHVSGYYLSHVFSQESNFSLFAYLTALRMEKAKALLTEGDLNVSEVALAVGYQNPKYFSKAFRKQCGCPPTEYAASRRGRK